MASLNLSFRFGVVLAAVLTAMIVMFAYLLDEIQVEEMPVEEMSVEEIRVCEVFEPPVSEKQAEEMTPREVVEQITWGMRAKFQCNEDYYADNPDQVYGVVNEILLPRFDPRYAAQLVLGRHWQSASAEQRERFITALYPHFMQFYAGMMLSAELETLDVLPFDGDATKKRVRVKTTMRTDLFKNLPWANRAATVTGANYGMVSRETGWLMFDFTIEGLSYVRNLKAEVNAEIDAKGLDSVIERLEADTVWVR